MKSYPYAAAIEAAKRWLGSKYLLAKPINRRAVAAATALALLAGCASTHVIPTGRDSYIATVRFCGVCTASATAVNAADAYCKSHGQVSTVTNVSTVFGSGAADVRFTCSSESDQKESRPDNGTSTIEIK